MTCHDCGAGSTLFPAAVFFSITFTANLCTPCWKKRAKV